MKGSRATSGVTLEPRCASLPLMLCRWQGLIGNSTGARSAIHHSWEPAASNDARASIRIRAMFVPSPHVTDRVQRLASQVGCAVGDFAEPYGAPKPALLGSLSSVAMTLREFGARWDRTDKVYFFANWALLEAALQHLVDKRV
jgi:hypothetical protein